MKNMKIVKSLEDCGLLIKRVTQTVPKNGFLSMLLGTLDASLLGNLLSGKGIIRVGDGVIRADDGIKKERIFNVVSSFD